MDRKNAKNNGGYSMEDIAWHQHSNHLMLKILELWPEKSKPVVDLGCGHNFYMNVMKLLGHRTKGFDHVPFPGVEVADITSAEFVDGGLRSLWGGANVLSLEVGEHVPYELSPKYLDNLVKFGGDIIVSWAIPGQAGIGHINCQANEWVSSRMYSRGYQLDHPKTAELRSAVAHCHCTWFRNTLMYYKPRP